MAKIISKSLAFQHFKKTLESEIRNYYQLSTALIYSKRWWASIPKDEIPIRISEYPGDKRNPFNSIDLSPTEYLKNNEVSLKFTRENSIVNFITTFEVYLLNITRRLIYLHPEIISDSEIDFKANEIIENLNGDVSELKEWFADSIASKYMRNKTHLKMLKKIEKLIKYDLLKSSNVLIEEWNKWTYIRNAVVHYGREVTSDLKQVWEGRFSNIGSLLELNESDITRVHSIALKLAKKIDIRSIEIIGDEDANLLVREMFVKDGIDDPKELSRIIFDILGHKIKTTCVEKCLGFQRRTCEKITGWKFSQYNFKK